MKTSLRTTCSLLLLATLTAPSARAQFFQDQAASYDWYGRSTAVGDFDGDGVGDLAVGIPGEDVGSAYNAGAVRVAYSLAGQGPGTKSHQYLNESVLGHFPRAYEYFGNALVAADFDGDSFDDLAIGAYGEDVGAGNQAGAVYVVYGGPNGLNTFDVDVWHQNSAGIAGVVETGDWFGYSLAADDFNDDGVADLAVGAPLEDIGSIPDAGAVNVIYGVQDVGLQAAFNTIWYQDIAGINDSSEPYDQYGWSLAAGDFDLNGVADLAVGVPYEDIGPSSAPNVMVNAGRVNVLRGQPFQGIQNVGDISWYPVSLLANPTGTGAAFGYSLTSGTFNNGNGDFLAIGAPYQKVGTVAAGRVHVIQMIQETNYVWWSREEWDQGSPGIAGAVEHGDHFGKALAAGSFSHHDTDALVIGVPGEDLGSTANAGVVQVLYFDPGTQRHGANGSQMWHQNSPGVPEGAAAYDVFGASLTVGDVTGEGFADLIVGVPGEDLASYQAAGAVHVLRGGGPEGFSGVTTLATQLLHEFIWSSTLGF